MEQNTSVFPRECTMLRMTGQSAAQIHMLSAQILHLHYILPGQVFMKNVVLLLQREINVYSNMNLLCIIKKISK